MNGILVVDKPAGFTSFDVVAKLRGICATKRIGHGGTLDPMATGVLPVFLDRAAKAVDRQPRQDKTYVAEVLFGLATDTGDVTGNVLEQAQAQVSEAAVREIVPAFLGRQSQLPPLYSAVKVAGKPLYKYAREGQTVDRKAREIEIFDIRYLGTGGENRHTIEVHCSKGTYIRTLAEELGKKLAVPATLSALRRTGAGVFGIGQAHTLEEIQAAKDAGRLQELVLSVEQVFLPLPVLALDGQVFARLQNGVAVSGENRPAGRYRAYVDGQFVGVVLVRENATLCVEKLY